MTAFTMGRLGVPFFLFLTGYLLLDRAFDSAKWQKFFHKNWIHLVITTEIWIILYDVFLRLFHYQHWSTTRLLKNILFLTPVNMPHIWYMPMIIGLYLFIPLAARGLQNLELQTLRMPLGIISIYAFAVPVFQVLWKDFSLGDIHSLLDYGFTGGVYGLYLLFGFLIKKGILRNIHTPPLWALFISAFCATILLQGFSYSRGATYNVWYDCGFLALSALTLFELFSRMAPHRHIPFLQWLSINSFGLYLIHFPFIMIFSGILKHIPLMLPFKVLLLWCMVLSASCFICHEINKRPSLSRLLLYKR